MIHMNKNNSNLFEPNNPNIFQNQQLSHTLDLSGMNGPSGMMHSGNNGNNSSMQIMNQQEPPMINYGMDHHQGHDQKFRLFDSPLVSHHRKHSADDIFFDDEYSYSDDESDDESDDDISSKYMVHKKKKKKNKSYFDVQFDKTTIAYLILVALVVYLIYQTYQNHKILHNIKNNFLEMFEEN